MIRIDRGQSSDRFQEVQTIGHNTYDHIWSTGSDRQCPFEEV